MLVLATRTITPKPATWTVMKDLEMGSGAVQILQIEVQSLSILSLPVDILSETTTKANKFCAIPLVW